MTKLGDIPIGIELGPGQETTVTVHTDSDVASDKGAKGGTTYRVPCKLENGKASFIAGGSRLIAALQMALSGKSGEVKVKVKAIGEAGSFAREWEISAL